MNKGSDMYFEAFLGSTNTKDPQEGAGMTLALTYL